MYRLMTFGSVYHPLTLSLLAALGIFSVQAQVRAEPVAAIRQVAWIHGSPD